MPPEMGVFDCPYKCPYTPLSGARLPLYTNAPIRLQMPPNAPLCAQMLRAMPADAPRAHNARPDAPMGAGNHTHNAPIRAGSRKPRLSLRFLIYSQYIELSRGREENAPKCPAMCGKIK